MKILIYGAGVIGCLYASYLSKNGYSVTIYARGSRLKLLKEKGLLYLKRGKIKKANVSIIDKLESNERYDYIFLTVREDQLHQALKELRNNISPTIVTMVNSLETYEIWENIVGKGRILPAFPGAGGSFKANILDAALTPRLIQPTTFAEIDGEKTERVRLLAKIFKNSHIPYQIVPDMHSWQICHLAMVVPIADAYYETKTPEKVGFDRKIMHKTAMCLKRNYTILHENGLILSPKKMHFFRFIPVSILSFILTFVYQSRFGNKFMYQHAVKAEEEMLRLHEQFYGYMKMLNER